jgi:hypothetical protein
MDSHSFDLILIFCFGINGREDEEIFNHSPRQHPSNTVNVLYNELYKIGSSYRMWAIFPEVSKFLTLHCCSQLRHHYSSHFGAYFIFLSFSDFDLKIKIR